MSLDIRAACVPSGRFRRVIARSVGKVKLFAACLMALLQFTGPTVSFHG